MLYYVVLAGFLGGFLLIFRTIQGIGLGGEVPVAAVFISELAKAKVTAGKSLRHEREFTQRNF